MLREKWQVILSEISHKVETFLEYSSEQENNTSDVVDESVKDQHNY
jgi:hypothetical protein